MKREEEIDQIKLHYWKLAEMNPTQSEFNPCGFYLKWINKTKKTPFDKLARVSFILDMVLC
jgi:hypothetical protein